MAYGEKYRFCAESQNGSEIKVLILQDGYSGQVYDRPMGRSPLLRRENSGMIMGSSFELYAECLVDAEYAELYTSSAREFKVEVYKDETVIWFGFITPELYSEPDIAPPYDVQIVATDGLGELKNYEFLSSGPESLYSHLVNLLQYTGLNLEFLIASTLQYIDGDGAESGQNSLLNFQIDLSHLEGENCYDVLQILLSSLNARIMMYDGQWLVYRETDLVHLASGTGLRVYDSDGLYKTLDVASFGSMTSCQWWPVGQLSSVIVPARNRLSIESPNHYKNNILDDSAWTVENSASYDSEEGAYILPDEGSNIVQKIEFGRELGSRLRLSILARNVGSGEEDQPIGIEVLIDGRSYAGARQYWLVKTADSDRGIGAYVWKTTEGQIEGELAIPSDSDTSDDAQEIEIILPLYANDSRSYFYASSVQVRLFNPAGTHDIYVYDCRLSLYNQKQGWKTDALIDNQAREDAGTTDVTMIDSSTALSTADIIMTGVPLDPQGRIIQNWKIGEDSEGSYLTVLTEDYAMGVALPRMKYTGTLNVPAGHIPSLFLRDGRFYSLTLYIYDMLNDEVEVELLSVPVADIEVSQEILPIVSATGAASSGSSGGSGGGIGSGGGSSIWDWFYLTEDGKSIGTKYNFFSELEISANGLHVGSGSGTGGSSTLEGLLDVTLSSPASGNILVYNGTHWVNKPQSELVPDIDLSDYYTRTEVDTKLGAYVKTDDADTKYAPLSGFNTLKSDFDALNAALNDDVSGKINTWNEIVDFVNEYSGSEDLATIISGINAEVNKRLLISTFDTFLENEFNPLKAKVTDLEQFEQTTNGILGDLTSRMVAAETAITTNATAIQAVDLKVTTLGNHMTEVDETIVAIQTQVSINKTNIEKILGWFQLDSSGNLYTTYNFYSTKEISANGLGQGTGGSGGSGLINSVLGVSALGTSLTEDNTAVFNAFATNKVYNDLVALTSRVDNLATTTSAVGWKGEIASGKKIGTLTINGLENYLYIPDKLSAFTDDVVNGKYLPLTGGTLSNGNFNPLTIKGNSSYSGIGFVRSSNDAGYLVYLGGTKWHVTREGWATGHDLLHLGNYSQYALQASNGDYYGVVFTSTLADGAARLILKNNNDILVGINSDGTNATLVNYKTSEWLGLRDGVLKYYDKVNERIVLHSGNIEDYAMLAAIGSHSNPTSGITKTGVTSWSNGVAAGYRGEYGTSLWVHFNPKGTSGSRWRNRLDFATTGQISLWQGINTETMSYIGELAYTHSNVASATKLATARTIWGQSFDGTGDIMGDLSLIAQDAVDNRNSARLRFRGNTWRDNGPYIQGIAGYGYGMARLAFFQSSILNWTGDYFEAMSILPSGKVGIGTTNPRYKIDVIGDVCVGNNVDGGLLLRFNMDRHWDFYQQSSGATSALALKSSTNSKNFIIQDETGGYIARFFAASTDSLVQIYTPLNVNGAVTMSSTLSAGATTLSSLTVNGGAVITSSAKINEVTYGYGTITFAGNIQINPTASGARVYLNTSTYGLTCTGGALSVGYIGEKSGYKFYVRSGNAYVEGNIAADGEVSANILNTSSDIRFKNRIEDVVLDLDTMADAPMFRFTWNNRKDDRVYIGSSAQYWKGTSARELVSRGCDDFHRLDYATLGVLFGVSLAKKAKNHEDRIKELESKVKSLEKENRRLRYGN